VRVCARVFERVSKRASERETEREGEQAQHSTLLLATIPRPWRTLGDVWQVRNMFAGKKGTAQEWKNRRLLTTNGLMCSKHVSQKWNEVIDNCRWYKMLLNLTLQFEMKVD